MKLPLITIALILTSFSSFSQKSSLERELDSLKTVHRVCSINDDLIAARYSNDSLSAIQYKLDKQRDDIYSFKIGRTKMDKERQIKEINALIDANRIARDKNAIRYKTLLNDLKIAKENVSKL